MNRVLLPLLLLASAALAAGPSPKPAEPKAKEKAGTSLTNIPLPIGQEAKGLVLPDIDITGHLRARFEAGTAMRVDGEHLDFKMLKMTTYTPENTVDMMIEMPASTLDLTTRVIVSHARTTVQRADFNITGDGMRFDTIARQGTLVGHVKMVVKNQSRLMGTKGE